MRASFSRGERRRYALRYRRRRKAARIISSGDRPSVLLRIGLEIDAISSIFTPNWSATIWASAV